VRLCERNYPTNNELVVVCFSLQLTSLESPTREIPSQPVLEPWREVGRPEGLCAVKGDPIPWVV
jgi:hypothetical protein